MKTKLFTIIFAVVFLSTGFSQVSWYSEDSGTNRELTDVCFVDQNNGWISGWTETMLHTTDGGVTWTPQTIPPNNAYYSVFFTDLQNGWASGYAGKISHTSDGGETWVSQTSPTVSDLNNLYFIDDQTGWAAGGQYPSFPSNYYERTILHTTNGGTTWSVQYAMAYKKLLKSIYFIDAQNGYATGPGGAVIHTSNGGNTWTEQIVDPSFDFYDVFFTNMNTGYLAGGSLDLPHYGGIFKTTDGGNTWTETQFGSEQILTGVYFPDQLNGWIAGNDYGNSNIGIIFHTTDGGENWSAVNLPVIDALSSIYFTDETHGWAAGHLGTIITTENPVPVELTSFAAAAENKDVRLSWQTASETNNSGFEVRRSDNKEPGTDNWEKIGFVEGRGTSTQKNNYSFIDKNLEAGSYTYRLVQIDLDGTRTESKVVNVEIHSIPAEYALMQNYPNPFNPSTEIEYSIPESGNVKLKVFNSLGQEVAVLKNGIEEAGVHKVNFNASNLSSGIYFYRLESGKYVNIRKMILLR